MTLGSRLVSALEGLILSRQKIPLLSSYLLLERLLVLGEHRLPLPLGRVHLGHLVLPALLLELVFLPHLRLEGLPLGQLGLGHLLDQPLLSVNVVLELELKKQAPLMKPSNLQ